MRTDDEIVDDMYDALSEISDEYDLVCWSRKAGTRFFVSGEVALRSVINFDALEARVLSPAQMWADMNDHRNTWIVPDSSVGRAPAEEAYDLVREWMKSIWDEAVLEDNQVVEPPAEVESITPTNRSFERKSQKETVKELFGGIQLLDDDGSEFHFSTFSESE